MPIAEIITIGTELLLGDILDTNAQFIARKLRDHGIDLYRKSTVGDNPQRIAQAIQQAEERADIILMTGGLGPTVDDPTREAVAMAVGVQIEFRPELWEQIQNRFRRYNRHPTENNKRQAYLPVGALAVENPVGTAPAFIHETSKSIIIALPGVPREMEHLLEQTILPYLQKRYRLNCIIKSRVLHTSGAGESQIDDLIEDLERQSNPTVGLTAHSGQVDVRITAKAESEAQADHLIQPIEDALRQRLGEWIYGADEETLESIALENLKNKNWTLVVVESRLNGALIRKCASMKDVFVSAQVWGDNPTPDQLLSRTDQYRISQKADIGLGVAIIPGEEKQDIFITIITPGETKNIHRPFGGPPEYAPRWAVNQSLDLLRKL